VSNSLYCAMVTDVIRLNSYMVLGVTIKRRATNFSDLSEADHQLTLNRLKQMNCVTFSMSSQVEHPTSKAKYLNHWSKRN